MGATITEQIGALQIEVRDKLKEISDNKSLKNADLARMLGRSESVISELMHDKKVFSVRLLNDINARINDFFIQKNGLIPHLRQFQYINNVVKSGKQEGDFRLLVGNTGLGKSVTMREFNGNNTYAWYFKIDRPMSWKVLMKKLCISLGIPVGNSNQYQLYDALESFFKERSSHKCILIIDEMEMLPLYLWLKLKGLFTTLENQVCLMMCCTPDYRDKLARKALLDPDTWQPVSDESNIYTTLARRLKVFSVPSVTHDDVHTFFRSRGVRDEEVLEEAAMKVWNYDMADKLLKKALRMGFNLSSMNIGEFSAIKIH